MDFIHEAETAEELNHRFIDHFANLKTAINSKYQNLLKTASVDEISALLTTNNLCFITMDNSDDDAKFDYSTHDRLLSDLVEQGRYDMGSALLDYAGYDYKFMLLRRDIDITFEQTLRCIAGTKMRPVDYDATIYFHYTANDADSLVDILGIDEVKRLFPTFQESLGPKSAVKTS